MDEEDSEKKSENKVVIYKTDISELSEEWEIVKKYFGAKNDSDTLRVMIKRTANLIKGGEYPN